MLKLCLAWWFTPAIPKLREQRQEDHKFQTSLGCAARPFLKRGAESMPAMGYFCKMWHVLVDLAVRRPK
jgi:hypothetical protein